MTSFGLSKNTMWRLRAKFQEFQQARRTIRENIKPYIESYRDFTGSNTDRRGTLDEEYTPRSPQMGWLIFGEGKNILWQETDIAVIIGRSQPSISRVLKRMETNPDWQFRLSVLSEEAKSANNRTITAYREGIFDLIIDKYEDEYLHKFIQPRRGTPHYSEEVMRFWDYLKTFTQPEEPETDSDFGIISEGSDSPINRTCSIFSLIFRKILTPKTGLIFTVVFALSFELVRRWTGVMPLVFGASLGSLGACVVCLHLRKFRAGVLSDAGAVAALMAVFWGLGLLSDGRVYTPGGTAIALSTEKIITLEPELANGHKVIFNVRSDSYGSLREIFYSLDGENYKSTGFNEWTFDEWHYPDLIIEPETQEGVIILSVKYLDTNKKEHGPFMFTYDMDKLRAELSKKAILEGNWLYVSRVAGSASVNVYINNHEADDVVLYVVYGINIEEPDKIFRVKPGSSRVVSMKDKELKYVSAYLAFKDGTISEIRRAE